jgi:hypothetical protein
MTPLPAGHLAGSGELGVFQKRTLTRAVAMASLKLRPGIAAADHAIDVEVVDAEPAAAGNSFKH